MDSSMLNEGPTDLEAQTSQKANMSGQVQNNKIRIQRQKDQMSQKMTPSQKSSTVYASEEYFNELRDKVELRRAKDKARVDWRQDLEEAAKERPQDEGDHPYVSIMPHTKKLPPKVHGNTKMENRPQQQDESVDFGDMFGQLLESDWRPKELRISQEANAKKPKKPFDPKARIKQRAAQMAKAPKKKDDRTDAQKMADATGPRPGSHYRGD